MRASTTSPIVVQGPKPTPPAPITTASGAGQPTSATIMSISDTKMANGQVALPPVNVGAAKESPGAMAAGQVKDPPPSSHGSSSDSAQANGADSEGSKDGSPLGNRCERCISPARARANSGPSSSVPRSTPSTPRPPSSGPAACPTPSMCPSACPAVGSSNTHCPEAALAGQHNRTRCSLALQYCAPQHCARLHRCRRPGKIHGFVNLAGRFEDLSIAFPPDFPEAQFVLNSLAQWQFRPATLNNQEVRVEVLLIIPETEE